MLLQLTGNETFQTRCLWENRKHSFLTLTAGLWESLLGAFKKNSWISPFLPSVSRPRVACMLVQSCPTLCNLFGLQPNQAPLSMGFPRQEYWKQQQGIFLTQGSKRHLLYLLHWQMNSLPLSHLGSYSPGTGYFEYPQVIFFPPGDFNVQPKLGTSGLKTQRVAHQTFRTGRVCVLCARWRMLCRWQTQDNFLSL